jgi:thiol-disulfide isomerase/thioredoxin
MMVNMLGNSYYKRDFYRPNIITILDSVSRFSKFKTNANTAHNMLVYLTKLENGYPAPEIHFERDNGDVVNWITYKGKFVYVNFFASWNQTSVTEMKLIKGYKEKYGLDIAFISFSIDKTQEDFNDYKEKNKDLDWDIFYLGENHELLKQFNIKTTPAYFLIDQEGYIAIAPAKSPSPNGVYESIDMVFNYIQTQLHSQPSRR